MIKIRNLNVIIYLNVENNNTLYVLENKVNIVKEENEYLNKEINNSEIYNNYLKLKLKELEEGNMSNIMDSKTKNELTFNNTSMVKTPGSSRNKEKEIEKLDFYFKRNEEILKQKIFNEEKQIKDKYTKFKAMESFKNPVLTNLNTKVKDYQFNNMNSKVSNQEIFFNSPENELTTVNKTKRVIIIL